MDIREDTTPQSKYFRLRDARAEARAAERSADNDPAAGDTGSAHWATIRKLATEALASDTKDIEVAAWLTEGLVRADGLRGLAAGAELLAGLVDRFWDAGLHPLPDQDGFDGRLSPVAGLNGRTGDGTLLQPLRKLALFERPDGAAVSLWQFEQAEHVAAIGDEARREQRLAAGVAELAGLEAHARGPGREALGRLAGEAAAALRAWEALDRALTEKAPDSAPSTRRVHDVLTKLRRLAERYGAAPQAGAESLPAEQAGSVAPAAAPVAGPGAGREELLDEIARIAARFRASEPNSPLGYTLDEAVRRARLPWHDLLREVLPEAAPRSSVMTGLGLRPPAD